MGLDNLLIKASMINCLPLVKKCLKHGANVHAEDDEALKWASKRGQSEVVELLKYYIESRSIS